jgi:hypothetical protein
MLPIAKLTNKDPTTVGGRGECGGDCREDLSITSSHRTPTSLKSFIMMAPPMKMNTGSSSCCSQEVETPVVKIVRDDASTHCGSLRLEYSNDDGNDSEGSSSSQELTNLDHKDSRTTLTDCGQQKRQHLVAESKNSHAGHNIISVNTRRIVEAEDVSVSPIASFYHDILSPQINSVSIVCDNAVSHATVASLTTVFTENKAREGS